MTNGMKSSEFKMSVLTMGVGVLLNYMGAGVDVIAMVCGTGIAYIGSRGAAKFGTSK